MPLTSTGYGDMYPVNFGWRVVAGVTMLLGLALSGILMNIVENRLMALLFLEQINEMRIEKPGKESIHKTMLEIKLVCRA